MELLDAKRREQQRAAAALPTMEPATVTAPPAVVDGVRKVTVNSTGTAEQVALVQNLDVTTGDTVLVVRDGSKAWVSAKLAGRALSPTGTIVSAPPASAQLGVNVAGVVYQLPFLASFRPGGFAPGPASVGLQVAIMWPPNGEGGMILDTLGTTLAPPPPPDVSTSTATPPPVAVAPVARHGTSNFPASDSGQYRSGSWGAAGDRNVYQGSYGAYGDNTGAWFYDTAPRDALTGATVLNFRIRLGRKSGGSHSPQPVHLYLHSATSKPGGDVTRTDGPSDAVFSIGEARWVDLPAAWGQAIVDSGGGIGVAGSPYVVLHGLDADSESGLLSFDWVR